MVSVSRKKLSRLLRKSKVLKLFLSICCCYYKKIFCYRIFVTKLIAANESTVSESEIYFSFNLH